MFCVCNDFLFDCKTLLFWFKRFNFKIVITTVIIKPSNSIAICLCFITFYISISVFLLFYQNLAFLSFYLFISVFISVYAFFCLYVCIYSFCFSIWNSLSDSFFNLFTNESGVLSCGFQNSFWCFFPSSLFDHFFSYLTFWE